MTRRYCTICGARTVLSGSLHYDAGRTFDWVDAPVGHHATLDPRFLLARLSLCGPWRVEVAADAG